MGDRVKDILRLLTAFILVDIRSLSPLMKQRQLQTINVATNISGFESELMDFSQKQNIHLSTRWIMRTNPGSLSTQISWRLAMQPSIWLMDILLQGLSRMLVRRLSIIRPFSPNLAPFLGENVVVKFSKVAPLFSKFKTFFSKFAPFLSNLAPSIGGPTQGLEAGVKQMMDDCDYSLVMVSRT